MIDGLDAGLRERLPDAVIGELLADARTEEENRWVRRAARAVDDAVR
jgi:hypothetical protein